MLTESKKNNYFKYDIFIAYEMTLKCFSGRPVKELVDQTWSISLRFFIPRDKHNFKQQQMNPQQQNQSQMYSQVIRARESPAVWLRNLRSMFWFFGVPSLPIIRCQTGSHFSLRSASRRREPIGDSMTQINLKSVFIFNPNSRYATVERPVLLCLLFFYRFCWVMPRGNLEWCWTVVL